MPIFFIYSASIKENGALLIGFIHLFLSYIMPIYKSDVYEGFKFCSVFHECSILSEIIKDAKITFYWLLFFFLFRI